MSYSKINPITQAWLESEEYEGNQTIEEIEDQIADCEDFNAQQR